MGSHDVVIRPRELVGVICWALALTPFPRERGDGKGNVRGPSVFWGTVGQGLHLSQCTHGLLMAGYAIHGYLKGALGYH